MRMKTFICGVLVALFLLSGSILAMALPDDSENTIGTIYLYTGSPLILTNDKIHMLDSANPDISATVVNGNTLLPLRAVSEFFGADVSYDQAKREAIINYGGKRFRFPIEQKKYIVEELLGSKAISIGSNSMIMDGRTMVPLRVICEQVLSKKVSYHNRIIAVSDQTIELQMQPKLMKQVEEKIGEVVKAGTMSELKKALTGSKEYYHDIDDKAAVALTNGSSNASGSDRNDGAIVERESASVPSMGASSPSMDPSAAAPNSSSAADQNYSSTNVQVEGIDEADVVKTDGKYIYIGGNNVVRMIKADQGSLKDETSIKLSTDKYVSEIYVADGKLAVLGTRSENLNALYNKKEVLMESMDEAAAKSIGIMPPYYSIKNYSFVDVYDISNPARPLYLKGHEMEGAYQSSRKNGEIIYLVTNLYSSGEIALPMMRDTVIGSKQIQMKLDDVMIMPRRPADGYLIVSAINVSNQEKTEVEAITAYGMTMYMNDSSLYLAASGADDSSTIIKFEIAGMKVGYAGSGEVKGHLINQFAMDEYEGNLRVATTTWGNENALYVLDPSLNEIGSVTGLAKGETIYSVRFMGDKGYIVTFRTIDPLFVFDLSDPSKPVVTGELKIPGFSSYLHPVGKNLLLGIGADTYEIYRKDSSGKDVVVGVRQGGIKYSLFDVSDMGKPREISNYVVGDSGSSSEAFYNHKAVMIDASSQNVALDASLNFENKENGYQQGAVIMGYEGRKLALRGILQSEPSGVYGNDIPYARRVLYIGNQLYYVQDGRITSYDYESLKKIADLVLR
ncbi:MAG: Beta propeller domain [Bacillota bacterium]|nr:Beta propeller domain [Bacillota bacterium]